MRVVIRGAGDLASGVALRLWRAGMDVVLLDVEKPTAIRRTVNADEVLFCIVISPLISRPAPLTAPPGLDYRYCKANLTSLK